MSDETHEEEFTMATAVLEPTQLFTKPGRKQTMMQAAVVEAFGKPLVLREWAKPTVRPGVAAGADRSCMV